MITAREHDVISIAWQKLRECRGSPRADLVISKETALWWLGTIVLLHERLLAAAERRSLDANLCSSIERYVGKRLDDEACIGRRRLRKLDQSLEPSVSDRDFNEAIACIADNDRKAVPCL